MAGFVFPVSAKYTITSPFGSRQSPTAGASSNHAGIDIGVPVGTNVLAASNGKITASGYSSARGNYIEIEHGNGISTLYQHLSTAMGKMGDTVKQGQVIAKSGNTGITTGPHLHFEVKQNGKPVNPMLFNMSSSGGENLTNKMESTGTFTTDGLMAFLKEKWWLIAGGLVLIAFLK